MKNLKPRNYRTRTSTETVNTCSLNPPFKVINGKVVNAVHDGEKWVWNHNQLWKKLGDVPVNNDGEIETDFLHFEAGTDREEIWSWFEETFDISVGKEFF